jgi:hypothetical protein
MPNRISGSARCRRSAVLSKPPDRVTPQRPEWAECRGEALPVDQLGEPEALIAWFGKLTGNLTRIGLEAGPLSQFLYAAMRKAGLSAELLETRHVRDAFKTMPVKTDRTDARGIRSRWTS